MINMMIYEYIWFNLLITDAYCNTCSRIQITAARKYWQIQRRNPRQWQPFSGSRVRRLGRGRVSPADFESTHWIPLREIFHLGVSWNGGYPCSSSGWWFGCHFWLIFPYFGFLITTTDLSYFSEGSNHQPVLFNRISHDKPSSDQGVPPWLWKPPTFLAVLKPPLKKQRILVVQGWHDVAWMLRWFLLGAQVDGPEKNKVPQVLCIIWGHRRSQMISMCSSNSFLFWFTSLFVEISLEVLPTKREVYTKKGSDIIEGISPVRWVDPVSH